MYSIQNEKLISIILSCYNSEKFLFEAIISVLKQDHENIELIFVNDGSTDNSFEIAKTFSDKDSRIKIISQSNKGLNDARNFGAKHIDSNSKALLFFDADDIMCSSMIGSLWNAMESDQNVGAAYCNFSNIDEQGKTIKKNAQNRRMVPSGKWFRELSNEEAQTPFFSIYSWTIMAEAFTLIRRDLFFKYGMWDEINFPKGNTFGESIPLFGMIALNHKVLFLNKELYQYRIHAGQITKGEFDKNAIQQKIDKILLLKCSESPHLKTKVQRSIFINKSRLPLYNYIHGSMKHDMRYHPFLAFKNLFIKSIQYIYSLKF